MLKLFAKGITPVETKLFNKILDPEITPCDGIYQELLSCCTFKKGDKSDKQPLTNLSNTIYQPRQKFSPEL